MNLARAGCCAVLLLAMCGSAHAEDGRRVQATRIDGILITGSWMPSDQPGMIAVRTELRVESIAEQDLLAVDFLDQSDPQKTRSWGTHVWCNDGTVVTADILEGSAESLTFRMPYAERLTLRMRDLAAVQWDGPLCRHDAVEQLLAEREPASDLLIAIQEDRLRTLRGTLEGFTADGGTFGFRGRSVRFSPANTCAVVLAGAPTSTAPPSACVLRDGSRIAGRIQRGTAASVTIKGPAAAELDIPLSDILALHFHSDRVVYLSELTPREILQHTVFGIDWPTRSNRAVSNRPMSMAGRHYDNGIGVHADSTVTYQLDEGYESLAATIGIDDYARPEGHVVFRVLGDGRELFNSGPLTGKDPPKNIVVRLSGARRLVLIVDHAEELDVGDHADWAEARLLR